MYAEQTLPENVEQVGFHNRRPVFRETVRVPIKELRRDSTGKVVYHLGPKGEEIRPRTEIVGWKEVVREYQVVALRDSKGRPTGTEQKNYHFREDPEVTAAREAERFVEQDLRDAATVAREHGTTLTDALRRLFGAVSDAAEEAESEETPRRTRKARG